MYKNIKQNFYTSAISDSDNVDVVLVPGVYKTTSIFIRKKGQRFVYICTPHQVKKK